MTLPDGAIPGIGGTGVLSPVTVAEFILHARIDTDADDTLIQAYLEAATRWAEMYNGRKFLTQDCVDYLDDWPAVIRPRYAPLAAVTSIQYIDTAGATQTWSSDEYDVHTASEPGTIQPAYGYSYPSLRGDPNGIIITYQAGLGSEDDIPEQYKAAIMMIAADLYENRENSAPITITKVPFAAQQLLGIDRLIPV